MKLLSLIYKHTDESTFYENYQIIFRAYPNMRDIKFFWKKINNSVTHRPISTKVLGVPIYGNEMTKYHVS